MTIQEIADIASKRLLHGLVPLAAAIDAVNEAIQELGSDAWQIKSISIASTGHGYYDLPTDCIKVKRVLNEGEYPIFTWQAEPGRILLYRRGTFAVEYFQVPSPIPSDSDGSDVPNCPLSMHHALPYYVAYRYDPKNVEAANWYSQYQNKIAVAKNQLQKKTGRRIRPPRWA